MTIEHIRSSCNTTLRSPACAILDLFDHTRNENVSATLSATSKLLRRPENSGKSNAMDDGNTFIMGLKQDTILSEIANQTVHNVNLTSVWEAPKLWMSERQVIRESYHDDNHHRDELAHVMHQLKYGKIVNVTEPPGGTQLKLLLTLEGGQRVIFKPQNAPFGNDQHNAEIVSFHLSRLLNLRRAPVAVGRQIDVGNELYPIAHGEFLNSFENKNCFRGNCEFCLRAICADPHSGTEEGAEPYLNPGTLEGVMILMLPYHWGANNNPLALEVLPNWYNTLDWRKELESNDFCNTVVKQETKMHPFLLDTVETYRMDFMIQNHDRHVYEYVVGAEKRDGAILFLDQGKSFTRTTWEQPIDDLRLLMPLTQCCVLRTETYNHLQYMSGWSKSLSEALLEVSSVDVATAKWANKILYDDDFEGLDRRMNIVLEGIKTCIADQGIENVLK